MDHICARVEEWVRTAWHSQDPDAQVACRTRPDGLVETTVVSALFTDLTAEEREALLWPALRELPDACRLRMTYSLLLTPEEAAELGPFA